MQKTRDRRAESAENELQRKRAFETTASWWSLWRREQQRRRDEVIDDASALVFDWETIANRWPNESHVARISVRMSALAFHDGPHLN